MFSRREKIITAHLFFGLLLCFSFFTAENKSALANENKSSATLYGPMGLNTVPSARMQKAGTVSFGLSALDPYVHGYLGFQISDPLFLSFRQTALTSGLLNNADRLYPGMDMKLRLMSENRYRPELSIGLQSMIGHKRMAGEYIALSKRYNNFDFTAGLGWGRLGSSGNIPNPFKILSSNHFSGDRSFNDEVPAEVNDWFTGDTIGIFGGVEYFTPIENLSLKLDYGADNYSPEQAAMDGQKPALWSAGLNYKIFPWIDLGLAALGTDKIMARLNLAYNLADWKDPHERKKYDFAEEKPYNPSGVLVQDKTARAALHLNSYETTPFQIGEAAKNISKKTQADIFNLSARVMNLRGPNLTLLREDIEKMAQHTMSTEELWRNIKYNDDQNTLAPHNTSALSYDGLYVDLENQFSLSEEDSGILHRSAIVSGFKGSSFFGLIHGGAALRINTADNLTNLVYLRPRAAEPVRSDVDLFAQQTIALENLYAAYTHSFRPDLHLILLGGYLEEMYAGGGGEVLYRPFGPRFALGAEAWRAYKRDPYSDFNLDVNSDGIFTGYLKAWYDLPYYDLTLVAKAGRFLAEDEGLGLSLTKNFKNGAQLEGFTTLTNESDFDVFGGTTQNYSGVRLSLPLGGYKYMPKDTTARVSIEPFGRDTGQSLKSPAPLYEITEPFSYAHIMENWEDVR